MLGLREAEKPRLHSKGVHESTSLAISEELPRSSSCCRTPWHDMNEAATYLKLAGHRVDPNQHYDADG